MSRDQKPGKLRVVGNGGSAPAAAVDRRESAATAVGSATEGSASAPASAAPGGDGVTAVLLPLILFLLACAIGGAAVAYLGLGR